MKVLKNMTLRYRDVQIVLYQIINYSIWYFVQSLPVLYQKGYQEFLESIDIQMVDRKKYYKNMHSLLGRMPFEELMKQNPYFVFKTIWRNPFKDVILWANETGLEYDYYQKKILSKFIDANGNLDEEKLQENYEKLDHIYIANIDSMYKESLNEKEFIGSVENYDLVKYFSKSYKLYMNENYCIIVNRVVDDKQKLPFQGLMLIDSWCYSQAYHVDSYNEEPTKKAQRLFASLNNTEPFNKVNFIYTCIDNQHEVVKQRDKLNEGTIFSKDYIIESLAKVSDESLLKELCLKKFAFIESVENRAVRYQPLSDFTNITIEITYEEIKMYKKELNNENNYK